MGMVRRSYDEFCGLSRALDVVGERWTLLIVRELMSGPKRYSDLADVLTGIGTSLLATRLKQLEGDGIVLRRYLSPPAASTVYELTAPGQELADAMVPLALWGARHHTVRDRAPDEGFHAEWALLFLARMLDTEAIAGIDASFEFKVGDSVATLQLRDGAAHVLAGPPESPADAVVATEPATMAAIAGSRITVTEAIEDGLVNIDGDPGALQSLLIVLQSNLGTPHGAVGPPRKETVANTGVDSGYVSSSVVRPTGFPVPG